MPGQATAPHRKAFTRRISIRVCPVLHPNMFAMLAGADQVAAGAQILTMAEFFAQSRQSTGNSTAAAAASSASTSGGKQTSNFAGPTAVPDLGMSLDELESVTKPPG